MTFVKWWLTAMVLLIAAVLADCLWSVTREPVRGPGPETFVLLGLYGVVALGGLLIFIWRTLR